MSLAATVYLTGAESISTSTFTLVPWDAALFQDETIWVIGSPTRLTVPAGSYTHARVNANIIWDSNATGDRMHYFWLNGGNVPGLTQQSNKVCATGSHSAIIEGFIPVVPGDYIECGVWQNSGGSRTIQTTSSSFSIELFRS